MEIPKPSLDDSINGIPLRKEALYFAYCGDRLYEGRVEGTLGRMLYFESG